MKKKICAVLAAALLKTGESSPIDVIGRYTFEKNNKSRQAE